jgi:hypothetical protein
VRLEVGRPRWGIGLAEKDGARAGEAGDGRRVGLGHVVGERWRSARGTDPGSLDGVLHGERETVQRTEPRTLGCGVVSPLRETFRPVQVCSPHRVHLLIKPFGLLGKSCQQLQTRDGAIPDGSFELGRRKEGEIVRHEKGPPRRAARSAGDRHFGHYHHGEVERKRRHPDRRAGVRPGLRAEVVDQQL